MSLSYCLGVERSSPSRRRWLGVAVSVCVCLIAVASPLSAQARGAPEPTDRGGFSLGQNYPNPFNPETTIPFTLGQELFVDGRPAVVTLRIFNILAQPVAYPVALSHPAGAGVELRGLEYTQPGEYEGFWDGTDQSGTTVASGIYFMQLTVNGQSTMRRMYVRK